MSKRQADGSCLCGAVQYAVVPGREPVYVVICHCLNCRRATGSAFALNAVYLKEDIELLPNPRHTLTVYADYDTDSGTPLIRKFCNACGSPLFATTDIAPDIVSLNTGSLHKPDATLKPPFKEQYVDTKAAWVPEFGEMLLHSRHKRGRDTGPPAPAPVSAPEN